jgi:archaeal type IV pilus assembly protein PilA
MVLKTLRRKLKGLTGDGEDRGVSPVIGVILMVAITVILAAVIGAFVLGLGDDLGNSAGPQAQVSFDYDDNELVILHPGRDKIEDARLGGDASLAEGEDLIELSTGDRISIGDGSADRETEGELTDGDTVHVIVGDNIVATYTLGDSETVNPS